MLKRRVTLGIFAIILAACTTFEIMIEKPTSPDLEAVSTLASLMLEGTQLAQILSERGITPLPPTPIPVTGQISGKLCYPGASTPALIVYFLDTGTNQVIDLSIEEYLNEYQVELKPGDYFIYAWVPQYKMGGLYSQKAICGNTPDCNDHSPVVVSLEAGAKLDGIDLCDWGFPAESLPLPAGTQLPGSSVLEPPLD